MELIHASSNVVRYKTMTEERMGEIDAGPPVRIYHRDLSVGHREWEDIFLTQEQIDRLKLDPSPEPGQMPDIILE
jgi:hypothetical protein